MELSIGLPFPEHAGCAGSRDGRDDRHHPCTAAPAGTVTRRTGRQTVRVFVCEAHAVGHPDPRPLTDTDRAVLRRRRHRVRSRR